MEFLRAAFAIAFLAIIAFCIIAALAPDMTRRLLRNILWPNPAPRKIAASIFAFALMIGSCVEVMPASAQTYPYQSPSYVPTSVLAPVTLSATGDYYFTANGLGGATVRVSALSGTLVAAIQGSNDALSVANASANWTTIQFIPVGGGSVANSITANGFYAFNPGGLTRFRVHVTTLSGGSHVVTLGAAGTAAPNALYLLNPQAVSGPVGIIGTDGMSTLDVGADGSAEVNVTRVAGAAIAQGHGVAATAIRVELPTDGTGVVGLAAGSAVVGTVGYSSDYPAGATPLTASATGTTAATTATLAGTSGKTTYLCGYSIMTSANAATVVAPTVTGTITGTLTMSQYVPVNTAGVSEVKREFNHCVPASATNTGIAVVSGAAGTGGVTAVNAWGYQL